MAFTVIYKKVAPAGKLVVEAMRLWNSDADSITAAITVTTALRNILGAQWGKLCTPTLMSTSAITWTNASTYPGHATVLVSGISDAAAGNTKIVDLVLWGRR